MCIWDFELFPVHWIIVFEMDFVEKSLYSAQLMFINADDIKVFD